MNVANKYCEYFDVDEGYFPQINDSAITAAGPDFWLKTYPHETFVKMLTTMERALSRQDKRSLWIEGAYGTGKSQCAYALKKILEVPENELRDYWMRYDPLRKNPDLLEKLLGHKQKGIVTAHRYASGSIRSPRDLCYAIQESIKTALVAQGLYAGENTLKESAIAWIDKPANKRWLNDLLQAEYSSLFAQSTADEVLYALRKGGEVKQLMDNISHLADKEGITALNIDADRLIAWLTDIMDYNKVKIVFIWDEFSDYFRNNRESLSDFQKLVELVNLKPFYFVVVTHESGQMFATADETWKKVRDRFTSVVIDLPDNIAFNLIGHAFNVKPAAKASGEWAIMADDLKSRVSASREAVMKATKIADQHVIRDIMPLHPMAALLLKHIASAFKSNQRSMFDYIKSSNTDDVMAFQWFIKNTGPLDDHPLLTVDMLWNFFYEKGRENLSPDIRLILDTFPQQQHLTENEKAVLKAILIMQALDLRLRGTIDLFKATEQNLSYVFEGITSGLDVSCKHIAKTLKQKGVVVANPIAGGQHVYAVAVLAGDQAKIDKHKEHMRESSTTARLVSEGGLSTVLSLSPALRLRFEAEANTGKVPTVTPTDFTRTINSLRDKPAGWQFHAVIAFAKDDAEAFAFRKTIKAAVADQQYEHIAFIDALSTPLGIEAFEQYVDYSAMAMYYHGNNNNSAKEYSERARHILDQDWKNRIYNGQFFVYTYANQAGEKFGNAQGVTSALQTIVTNRFPYVFDFTRNLTENQLKLTRAAESAKSGITQSTSGVVVGIEKHLLPKVWRVDDYWTQPALASLSISKIKVEVEQLIAAAFQRDGQIAIGEIYDFLEKRYGFAPCNLSAFLAGFLLKEYGKDPYRYSDQAGGHDAMTQDKLKEMLGNYIGKTPKPTYIVKMTPEEMAFYQLTEKAWRITPNSCAAAGQAAIAVAAKMRGLGLPVWCLAEIDINGVFTVVQKYIELVQKEGHAAHNKAIEIGKIAIASSVVADQLAALLTVENCQQGMRAFLQSFEDGKILSLAQEIGTVNTLLSDIRALFAVKHSSLWDRQTGEDEIRRLLTDYGIVRESNILLASVAKSRSEAFKEWRERLKFLGISCEALRAKFPSLQKVLETLMKVYQHTDLLPDHLKTFHAELVAHAPAIRDLLDNDRTIFGEVYAPYLEGLSAAEIGEIKSKLMVSMFELTMTDSNAKVKLAAAEFRNNQLKTQLLNKWRDATATKNPKEWSSRYKTPILCCVDDNEFGAARKTFATLDNGGATDQEVREAITFLASTSLFTTLASECARDTAFVRGILGKYRAVLPDLDKVRERLERLPVEAYDWRGHPQVEKTVKQLAEAEYNAGGSDAALSKIDQLDDAQLKLYLKRLVKENITVGLEIIMSGGE